MLVINWCAFNLYNMYMIVLVIILYYFLYLDLGLNIMSSQSFDYYAVILDESGSMRSFKNDTLGSLRGFFNEQRNISKSSSPFVVTTFNTTCTNKFRGTLSSELDIDYNPTGQTALYDAIGMTINEVQNQLCKLETRPADVYIIILTDGEENSSTKYSQQLIKDLIEKQKLQSWKFIYLGANQDAFTAGGVIGITKDSCMNYAQNSYATKNTFNALSSGIQRQKMADFSNGLRNSVAFTTTERVESNSQGNPVYIRSETIRPISRGSSHTIKPYDITTPSYFGTSDTMSSLGFSSARSSSYKSTSEIPFFDKLTTYTKTFFN